LVDNPFENLRLTGLTLDATIEHANRGGRIVSVNVDRLTVAPGDEIHAMVEVEPFQKEHVRVPLTIKVPADAAEGDCELGIGTASMAISQESDYAPQHFDPQDIAGLETAIEHITGYQAEKIYGTLVMNISGAAVAGQEKSDLPASRMALYASSKRTDASPV